MGPARDPSTPVLAAVLLAVAAPALGGPTPPFLPTDPAATLALAAYVVAAWAAVVVPAAREPRPTRALEALLVAAPAVAALLAASPAGTPVLWEVPAAAAAFGAVAASLPERARRAAVALATVLLAAGPLLADVVGEAPRALATPVAHAERTPLPGEPAADLDLVPTTWREGAERRPPLRRGALARAPAPGAWGPAGSPYGDAAWIPVPRAAPATIPVGGPVVRVVGPSEGPLPGAEGGAGAVVASSAVPTRVLDLDAFDAVYLPAATRDADLEPEAADALASFVRRGGLLVGAWHGARWPTALARRLAAAGAIDGRGPTGARAFGLGHVARAATEEDVRDLLASTAASPAAGTAFDRALEPPSASPAFPRWSDDAPARRGAVVMLALFVGAVFLASGGRGLARAFGIVAVAAAATAGTALATASPPTVVATPFSIDLGGAGGRRVEGLFVAAGPRGALVPDDLRAAGGLRLAGFSPRRVDGRLRWALPAFHEGWIVEEGPARGDPARAFSPETSLPAWARGLVTRSAAGEASLRIRVGEAPYEGPTPGGWGSGEGARGVVLLGGAPDRP